MNCNTTHYRANSSSVPGDPTLWAIFIGVVILIDRDYGFDSRFACSRSILILGVIPGAALFYMIRSAAPLKRNWSGAFVALAAAALGGLGAQFTCETERPMHIFMWHILPVFVLGGLGTLLGRVLVRKRAA